MSDVRTRMTRIFIEHLGVPVEKLTDDARLVEDLLTDSLDIVELSLAVEDEFGFVLDDEVADAATMFGSWVAAVEVMIAAAADEVAL
jgi:acyl carrier protein